MPFTSRFYATTALVYFIALATLTSAQAGQLFPPNNLPDPKQSCPNGQVLSWTGGDGTVDCTDPTPGVTVPSCPAGQGLTGLNQGVATCQPLFGGMYQTNYSASCNGALDGTPVVCRTANPLTGACSCPQGFQPQAIFDFNKCTHPAEQYNWWFDQYNNGIGGLLIYYCYAAPSSQ
ncbi:MAG: hypothetical protein ABR929_04780 [Roseiarcus sp.]|jgi:hypothetical protein